MTWLLTTNSILVHKIGEESKIILIAIGVTGAFSINRFPALRGAPLTVHGDGRQRRCFCHVADLVAGADREERLGRRRRERDDPLR